MQWLEKTEGENEIGGEVMKIKSAMQLHFHSNLLRLNPSLARNGFENSRLGSLNGIAK